jgi:hypothetical protein
MKIFSAQLKGTTTVAEGANVSLTGSFSGSIAGIDINSTNTFTSSTSARLDSIETISASNVARISSLENLTGSLATTGSNTFYGQQVFSGSLYVQDNLIVQGSSSLQNITASAVSIGTNIVYLNTDTPAVRFAGLTVQDSGSNAGVTGSMFWDSLCNRWIYSNPSTIGYSGGMLLSGPRAENLGEEITLTCNYIAKSGGGDHLYNSCIQDTGTTTCFYGTSYIKSTGGAYYSGNVGIGTENAVANLTLKENETCKALVLYGRTSDNLARIDFYRADETCFAGRIQIDNGTTSNLSVRAQGALQFQTGGSTNRLIIDNTGVGTFSCQLCSLSFRAGSSSNTTNGLSAQNASTAEATIYSYNHCTAGWSLYSAQGINYFKDSIGINDTAPSAKLQIRCANTWGDQINESINIVNSGANGNINIQHNMGAITWYSGAVKTAAITAWRNVPASGDFVDIGFATSTAGTQIERMRIMSNGCVGIGNSSPNTLLHTTIQTCWATNGSVLNSYPIATFSQCDCAGGARGLQIGVPTGGINSPIFLKVANTGARFSILDSSNNEDFTISGGRIGIGASSPSADGYLHICKNTNNVGILIQSVCKTSNPSYLRLLGINSNNATTQLQIVHRGSHSDSGYTDRIDFSVNNGTSWCERVMRFDFNGNVGMCHGSLSIADQIAIGGTGTAAAKGYKKFYSFGSGFDNPTINLISVGNPTNSVTVLKVTVYTTGFGSNTANIHTGYAMKSWVGSYACPMSIVQAFGNNNVGTIAWSGETLTYTANRISNYDSYHVEVDYGGSNGSMSASWF